jgi:hypothetical protein
MPQWRWTVGGPTAGCVGVAPAPTHAQCSEGEWERCVGLPPSGACGFGLGLWGAGITKPLWITAIPAHTFPSHRRVKHRLCENPKRIVVRAQTTHGHDAPLGPMDCALRRSRASPAGALPGGSTRHAEEQGTGWCGEWDGRTDARPHLDVARGGNGGEGAEGWIGDRLRPAAASGVMRASDGWAACVGCSVGLLRNAARAAVATRALHIVVRFR